MKAGDFLTGNTTNEYSCTNKDGVYVVIGTGNNGRYIDVKIIGHKVKDYVGDQYLVESDKFDLVDIKEIYEKHESDWYWATNIKDYVGESTPALDELTFEWGEPHHFTDEEIRNVAQEILEHIESYEDFYQSFDGCYAMAKEWAKNMSPLIGAMERDPDYNGRYQIAKGVTLERKVDKNMIRTVCNQINDTAYLYVLKDVKIPYTRSELDTIISHLRDIKNAFGAYPDAVTFAHYPTYEDALREYRHFAGLREKYDGMYMVWGGRYVTSESRQDLNEFHNAIIKFSGYYEPTISQEFSDLFYTTELVNGRERRVEKNKKIKVPVGAKTSRVFLNILKAFGLNEAPQFDTEWRINYGDAINPLEYRRWTILSAHPVDYLTSSNGTNWSSCHNPDSHRDDYHGMYMSGTISYMLDNSSLVMYTLKEEFDGDKPEFEPKETRQMFHIGEDKIVQGRLYPYDQTDRGRSADPEDYVQYRNIVQNLVANMFNVPNSWILKRGTEACGAATSHTGTHYRDVLHYENCNVSTLRGSSNTDCIHIGHRPICPLCGETHSVEGNLNCPSCENGRLYCADCGEVISRDDAYEIDGRYYCEDCVSYCEYHQCYEANTEMTYVEDYGDVCEDALESGDFICCDNCDTWYRRSAVDYVVTDDGYEYCCEDCARDAGYVFDEETDEWIRA